MSCNDSNTSLPIGLTGPAGDDGAPGSTGASGTTILYSTTTPVSTVGPFTSLATHTLLAADPVSIVNSLETIGDSIEVICTLTTSKATPQTIAYANVRLFIGGGSALLIPPTDILIVNGSETCLLRCMITRTGVATVFVQFDAKLSGGAQFTHVGGQYFHNPSFATNNLDSATNDIEIRGGMVNGTLTLQNLLILKYKI